MVDSGDFFEEYTVEELMSMTVLHSGQYDNLLMQNDRYRLWHSRMTVADGAPYNHQVTVEKLQDGCWVTVKQYEPSRRSR